MKKLLSIILSFLIIIPSSVALAADGYTPSVEEITQAEAYQFADELKKMNLEEYDISSRLIVNTNKDIDYLNAIDIATGIEGLYVLQFPNTEAASQAYEYYDSLSYVNYVEYDAEIESSLCSTDTDDIVLQNTYTESESEFDFVPDCPSTVNQNIDDAIKLLKKENAEFKEIKMAVLDSGIVKTKITNTRIDGGHTFIEGFNEDGTSSTGTGTANVEHGTKVAGTIILNTLNNVRLYSYQVVNSKGSASYIYEISSIYLAIADGCKIINMSSAYYSNLEKDVKSWNDAINTATASGCICVASAGNDGKDINVVQPYPAMVENTIVVGATTPENRKPSFSNFGDKVDIYAVGNLMTSYNDYGNKVTNWGGTSGSAPVISSICALLVTAKPDITVDEIKQLLLETGYSTNEENQTDDTRIIADAYGCVKKLLGSELEPLRLDYTVNKSSNSDFAEISFTCNDENANIYYQLNDLDVAVNMSTPFTHATVLYRSYKYEPGTTVKLKKYQNIVACAYAPGKAKSNIQYFLAPDFSYESGYLLTPASKSQQYNKITRCNIIDEKVITVPEFIDETEIQEIGQLCFMGNKEVEKIILPESVKQIDAWAFANCPNLKTVIAPGVENCGGHTFYKCDNLINVEMPNVTVANVAIFKNCHSLETAKLGTLTEIDNHAFYGCENLKLVKTTEDNISFAVNTFKDCDSLTIHTPKDSTMETYAKENNIPLLGEVKANGSSIRVTDAGLRFGYEYDGEYNPNIEEYGFVYNSGVTNDLTVDNALKLIANNRIDHGNNTTYNLVFTNVPYTDKAFNQMISAKAYIKIGDEYFYSDVVQHSYNTVADAVLKDNKIDSNTKDAVQNILDKVV